MGLFTGCTDAPPVTKPVNDKPVNAAPPQPEQKETPPPVPTHQVTQYIPPAETVFPQAVADVDAHNNPRYFYHPYFVVGDKRIKGADPLGLKCSEEEKRCYFGVRNKIYSFSSQNLANSDPIPAQIAANFSGELDGQERQFANILVSGNYFYGLYDNYNLAYPEAGIVIHDRQGNAIDHYFFPKMEDSSAVSCPYNMLPVGNEIWVTVSNCVGHADFKPGKIFTLTRKDDGTLQNSATPAITTTQRNPQAIAGWNANNNVYLLVVNTGVTTHLGDQIFSESGVDVVDAETHTVVANIPLGKAAANTITISGDNTRAFLGSQNRPYAYAIDLEWLAIKLANLNRSNQTPAVIADATISNASNPMLLAPITQGEAEEAKQHYFIPSIQYNDQTGTVFASSFNDSRLLLLHTGLSGPLGMVGAHYACAKAGTTEQCSDIALLREGALVLTNLPGAGLTFFPNTLWGE